jgi:hypothetical protein
LYGVSVAIAEHNRDDAGNEWTTSFHIKSATSSFRGTSHGFIARWRLMHSHPNVAGGELSPRCRMAPVEYCRLRFISNCRIFPCLFRSSKREKPHAAAEP